MEPPSGDAASVPQEPTRHICEACNLVFPSELLLLKHRAKFCSVLVPLWANRLAEASRDVVDPADLARYFGGGKPPSGIEGARGEADGDGAAAA